jgi:hypothetical protein
MRNKDHKAGFWFGKLANMERTDFGSQERCPELSLNLCVY